MSARRDQLPENLADILPGPELAAALAEVDHDTLNGHDLINLAPLYVKLISHLQARLADVLSQVEHCPPGDADTPPERAAHTNRWASIDVAAKLHWSTKKAEHQLRYAQQLVRRLPLVHAALGAGIIDWDRARTIIDGVAFLQDLPAQLVAAKVLTDGAGSWTVRKLADRLRREKIAYDAKAAQRRRRERQRDRFVQADPHPDGTTNLHGWNLPPHRVAEIMERLTAIARTAKRQGDGRTADQLMADTLCDLLAGTGIGATPPRPVTNPGPTGHPDLVDEPADPVDHPGGEPAEEPGGEPADDLASKAAGTAHEAAADTADSPPTAPAPAPLPGPRRGVIHLLAPLSTAAGLTDEPGELAGYGPVAADIVRQVIADNPEAQWRFSLFDDHTGHLLDHGITTARPTPPRPTPARPTPPQADPPTDTERGGFSATDVAFIRARDRTCRGPQGCHVPAADCETDHTTARADGGGHDLGNAGPLCKREHMYKHQSGATLEQPEPGVFRWTTQFGHTYEVRPEPYEESTGPPEPGTTPTDSGRRLARILALSPASAVPQLAQSPS